MFNTNSWSFGKKSEKCRGFTSYVLSISPTIIIYIILYYYIMLYSIILHVYIYIYYNNTIIILYIYIYITW